MYVDNDELNGMGSLKSFFKKVVKTATKLSPSHQIAKALKIDKFSPSHILVNKLIAPSAPKAPSAPVAVAPDVPISANTPEVPTAAPQVTPIYTQPMSFTGGGGGGSALAPLPADVAAPVEEENYLPWILGAAGVGLAAILLFKKKR